MCLLSLSTQSHQIWQEIPGKASAEALRTLWLQELLRHGVLASLPIFPMTCYTPAIVEQFCHASAAAVLRINAVRDGRERIEDALRCPVIEDVFHQRYAAPGQSHGCTDTV